MLFMQGPANVAMFFDSLGIPLAGLVAWLVIALKLGAGGALMIGYKVEEAAAALILFYPHRNCSRTPKPRRSVIV